MVAIVSNCLQSFKISGANIRFGYINHSADTCTCNECPVITMNLNLFPILFILSYGF